ncbi:PIG-L family deacetylase [Granulicella sp. 5B5]|uniref:PIG-L family deacetylase n=1 Tax=Granulicella sp. 5B5 TaxID=1617967 RepID=UPI0015F5DB97|nr:PIG-L family deacetylase [Granulicella sp. 5B5]QMV20047.1 PIG-L family deacetylase [Granulicella sp. 5B5]
MKLLPSLGLAATLAVVPSHIFAAQTPTKTFFDPANLRGEHVQPLDGHELPIDQGALGLQQMLRRLNTRASILNIVAHPDDEDGGMLTFYSRGRGARVADLSLNRGEGGQNAMTPDFEDALGLLRTQELLACDRYSGIHQFFGTEVDFGFSKTKEEAFSKWTHQRVLYDVVRAIRLYRPLVLTATFIGGVTDGHGQHQVSGEIAQEAFKAAGDPSVFPELTAEGILPWQPLKVYARVPMFAISDKGLFDYATNQYIPARFVNYVTGQVSTTPPTTDVVVHEGESDPLLTAAEGKPFSYVQFARMGLGMQKSQIGPGLRVPPAGKFDVAYHRYGSMLPADRQKQDESSFFDGIDTSIEGIATLAPSAPKYLRESLHMLGAQISNTTQAFDAAHPEKIAPQLADALQQTTVLISRVEGDSFNPEQKESVLHELRVKRVQLNSALALALGLNYDATNSDIDHPAGNGISVWSQVRTASSETLHGKATWLTNSAGGIEKPDNVSEDRNQLTVDHPLAVTLTAHPYFTTLISQPYFYRKNIEAPVYELRRPELRDAPVTPPALTAWTDVEYRGTTIELGRIVHDGPQPIQIVPAVNLALSSNAQVLPEGTRSLDLTATATSAYHRDSSYKVVKHEKPSASPSVHLQVPALWSAKQAGPVSGDLTAFIVTPPADLRAPASLTATVSLPTVAEYTEGYRAIGYGDLPRTDYYTPAVDRIVPVDLKLPSNGKLRIGYLPGTGDSVPEALASIGLKPEILTVADLTAGKLGHFDTVILGVRTYAAHPELHGAPTQALLAYARGGGNVVVQYQTAEFTADDAPYPLTLGSDAERVVDETDPVALLDPASPLLSTPNRITPADFNGWIEERGHGFLGSWDAHYTALTEVHDPGAPAEGVRPEEPQRGGLITTQLGKGRWTYLAFAVYRQLPEAVPGAYRLFVNLLNR